MDPSEALRAGRRALDGVPGVNIERDWRWDQKGNHFRLQIRIHIAPQIASRLVPQTTHWYVVVEPCYPFGEIKVRPAKHGGIDRTFPHQSRNDLIRGTPFRKGNLCLDSPLRDIMGMRLPIEEPLDAHLRLAWYIRRAKAWVEAAGRGALLALGDHYELPAIPEKLGDKGPPIVFSASAVDLVPFLGTNIDVGLAVLAELPSETEPRLVVLEWRET